MRGLRGAMRRTGNRVFPLAMRLVYHDAVYSRLHLLPRMPRALRRRRFELPPRPPRQPVRPEVPARLLTAPGPIRDDERADAAWRAQPLRDFWCTYRDAEMWLFRLWWWALPVFPRYLRGIRELERTAAAEPARAAPERSPRELSDLIRAEAHRLGLTSVGFTAFDPRYAYVEKRGGYDEGSVIVCVLEEDFDTEQRAPSRRHERATFEGYTEIFAMMCGLASFVQGLGFRAQPHDIEGPFMYIPFAAQAGLGQMGYNGQLLTPGAGARNILAAITTNAALAHDEPVDYGIPGICSQCRVCIRRCPVGALPGAPSEHRGVTKTKLKTERCLPVVAQADGCAVCAKTCPVQRYGLSAVLAHLEATGEVLGKGTAELETFEWPLDGRAYGPGQKPRVNGAELLHPAGLEFDIRALTRPFADTPQTKETT